MATSYVFTLTFSDPNNTDVIEVLGTAVGSGKNSYSTSLDLVGPGYVNYGQDIAQNFVKLLEHFAGPNPPSNAIKGQLWFDTSNPDRSVLRVNNGAITSNRWPAASGIYQQTQDPSLSYSQSVTTGDVWVDTGNNQVKIWAATDEWITVGPSINTGENKSGSEASIIQSNTGSNFPVILNWSNGKVVEIISYSDFTPRTVIDGFSTIKAGTNLTAKVPARYNGIAETAAALYVSPGVTIRATDVLKNRSTTPQIHTGTFVVQSSAGLQIKNPNNTVEEFRFYSNGSGVLDYLNTGSTFKLGISSNSFIKFTGETGYIGINNLDPQASLDVLGQAKISNTLTIVETADIALDVAGGIQVDGSLTVGTDISVAGVSSFVDLITVGEAGGSGAILVPAENDSYELGSPTNAFRHLYVSKIGTTGTTITIYGAVSRAIELETARDFTVSGQMDASAVSFNGLTDVDLAVTVNDTLITDQSEASSTTSTDTLLVINTATGATTGLQRINKANFLADLYAQVFQTGMIIPSAVNSISGFLLCDGSSIATTAQPDLFAVIGYDYGGSGGNFSVPDMTGVTTTVDALPIYYLIKT